MNDQRTELSGLAKQTIRKCETIIKKFQQTVAGDRELNSGMRSILRSMRSLLLFSERKLKEAKDTILTMREKINKIVATLRVFKGLVEVAKRRDARLSTEAKAKDVENIIGGVLTDIQNGVDGYRKASRRDQTTKTVTSVISGLTRLTTGIIKAVNRPKVGPMLSRALTKTNAAIDIVTKQKEAMEKEVELIIVWKDAVDIAKNDVFQGELKGGKQEDQDLFDEIKDIIDDEDVDEIYEAFNDLKGAAQNYLTHVESVCRACTE
jgi:uncharacterized protein YoxC